MENTIPIACTLTDADLRDRKSAWLKVGAFATEVKEIEGGVAFGFTPVSGVRESLKELIRLEAQCCAWMTLSLTSSRRAMKLSIIAAGDDGQRGVRESFAPLAALVRR